MKRLINLTVLLTFILLSCNVSTSQKCLRGKGQIKTQEREVKDFTKITIKGSQTVNIKYGEKISVRVSDYENLLPHLKTEVNNGDLVIDYDQCVNNSKATIYITMPQVEAIDVLGSGDVTVQGNFRQSDKLSINIAGSGDVSVYGLVAKDIKASILGSGDLSVDLINGQDAMFNIAGSGSVNFKGDVSNQLKAVLLGSGDLSVKLDTSLNAVYIKTTGSGDCVIEGKNVENISLQTMGSGDIDAGNIKAQNAQVMSTGSGDIQVNVSQSLEATLMGSGDLKYKGNPSNLKIKANGSGDIIH